MPSATELRCGIVGAGRRRNGLGPFFAAHLEAGGGRVVGVSGRSRERTRLVAEQIGAAVGHSVGHYDGVEELLEVGLDALVVAAPVEVHLPSLRAALAAGVPTLCEKPLVRVEEVGQVSELVRQFQAAGLVLVEHCQWPLVLPAWRRLYPEHGGEPVREFEMGLSPAAPGPQMLSDSFSHFVSLLQALVPVGDATVLGGLRFVGHCGPEDGLNLSFVLERPFPAVDCRLTLQLCKEQPRPAWFAIDGLRADRRVALPDYQMSLCAADRNIAMDDPSAALVYRFLSDIREAISERDGTQSDQIKQRARLYRQVLVALVEHLA